MRIFSLCGLLILAPSGRAQADLQQFLRTADETAPETAAAIAEEGAQDERASAAKLRLLPTVTLQIERIRNEPASKISLPGQGDANREIVFTPKDQLSAAATASLPLIHVSRWRDIFAENAQSEATALATKNKIYNLKLRIGAAYFSLLANRSLLGSLTAARSAAQKHLEIVTNKKVSGLASDLDVARASAEVEKRSLQVANGQYALDGNLRLLKALTGIDADLSREPESLRTVAEEAGAAASFQWLPSLVTARAQVQAAEARVDAARGVYFPTVSINAQRRWSNPAGMSEESFVESYWLSLKWTFEAAVVPELGALTAQAKVAKASLLNAELSAKTSFDDLVQRREVAKQSLKSAEAERDSTRVAAELVSSRYTSGLSSLYELIVAERDRIDSEVSVARALADLAFANFEFSLLAGENPSNERSEP